MTLQLFLTLITNGLSWLATHYDPATAQKILDFLLSLVAHFQTHLAAAGPRAKGAIANVDHPDVLKIVKALPSPITPDAVARFAVERPDLAESENRGAP